MSASRINDQLDRDGVIISLTDGVGFQFGRAARKSFYRQLERLEANPSFRNSPVEEQQFLMDLLALASFYQTVIIPINSSAHFVSVLRKAGATHLRVAGDKLDRGHAIRALATSAGFRLTLNRAEIPEHLLQYPSLKGFISSAHKFHLRRKQ